MVRKETTRAMNGTRDPRRDGLVDRYGTGGAVVRGTGLVGFALMPLVVLALALALAMRRLFLLLDRAMAHLLRNAVQVEGGHGLARLAVHREKALSIYRKR